MAHNRVAANLLMLFIVVAGLLSVVGLPQETFPEVSLNTIRIRVEYPGAAPEEVDQALVRRIEDAIGGVAGIDRITSLASENVATVFAEVALHADPSRVLDQVKSAVDRITSFPEDAERPVVSELTDQRRVMAVAIYGQVPERTLKELAQRARDDLAALPGISLVSVSGVRSYEVSIEVPSRSLRSHELTLDDIAAAVRRGSLDLPGGRLQTESEDILVRVGGLRDEGAEFADIVVGADIDGSSLRLGDVAEIRDGFRDSDLLTTFNGQPAALVHVSRAGDERVTDIAEKVRRYLDDELAAILPNGVRYGIWLNEADLLQSRISLLVKNGLLGLLLVVLALTLFLDLRLAWWTAVGIFVSFAGVFFIMSLVGLSLNMMSLFGFILAIGIVVDDAIVVGENIFAERENGASALDAAVRGTHRVGTPVIFAVLTTVAAFTPLLVIPGSVGKFLYAIPTVVISVLLLSLVEVLFILPRHLSHAPPPGTLSGSGILRRLHRLQDAIRVGLQAFVEGPLERTVRFSVERWGLALLGSLAALLVSAGLVAGNHIRFGLLPEVESELVVANLEMPEGTPSARTREIAAHLEQAGYAAVAELEETLPADEIPLVQAVFTSIGEAPGTGSGGPGLTPGTDLIRSNIAEVSLWLADPEVRNLPGVEVERAWRDRAGPVAGASRLDFSSQAVDLGAPVHVELSHTNADMLASAVTMLSDRLAQFVGVTDVRDDRGRGKSEIRLDLTPQARTLGIDVQELARQIRAALVGTEALRLQRGSEEVRVYVRLPKAERNSLEDLRDYPVRTQSGAAPPLSEIANLSFEVGPAAINRIDGHQVATVTADVDTRVLSGRDVNAELAAAILPEIEADFPGLRHSLGGAQRETSESLSGLGRGFALALFAMYALLAVSFGSYRQPVVVMAAIPFGFVGAALGHLVLGLDMGVFSIFAIVGLSGVVVNDSLVLINFVNALHKAGTPMPQAIVQGAKQRFRPIMLTSVTTFVGVFPIIAERSTQAQFLVPMAATIAFGVLFATVITMITVPALAMANHSLGRGGRGR